MVKNTALTREKDSRLEIASSFWRSWQSVEGIEPLAALKDWIAKRNSHLLVEIENIHLSDCQPWFYDSESGRIHNGSHTFFEIGGIRVSSIDDKQDKRASTVEQPILIQDEIGFLGIICREMNGVMHFLMQAKIEPGNVNKVQISPTLQATRSNFMQLHGGRAPAFLEYFTDLSNCTVIVDQIQSEQSSRFLGKRNRNVIVLADGDLEKVETHRWMTLGQIKQLMHEDNLVNMDTRTVLSCIPWALWPKPKPDIEKNCNPSIFASITTPIAMSRLNRAYSTLSERRMFNRSVRQTVRLDELKNWEMASDELFCKDSYPFKVIFCNISIEGREVRNWKQPMFAATGKALFGLFTRVKDERQEFLVKAIHEIGCFDYVEFGPTVQREADSSNSLDVVEASFMSYLTRHQGISHDVILSEEGGRFYHEQNRNTIIHLDECPDELNDDALPSGYLWLDYKTLGLLVSCNNNLNIQLRNLLSLLEI